MSKLSAGKRRLTLLFIFNFVFGRFFLFDLSLLFFPFSKIQFGRKNTELMLIL
jgi:hypothetical protein